MSFSSRLHVITARENCEPRGLSLCCWIDGFEDILVAIAQQDLDTHDPGRGLRDIMKRVVYRSCPPLQMSFNAADLDCDGCEECLTIDFARDEVKLRVIGDEELHCDLDAAAVRPLIERIDRIRERNPYFEPSAGLDRATIRIIAERNGAYGSGVDLHHAAHGSDATLELLNMLGDIRDATMEWLFVQAWYPARVFGTVVPFQELLLGDEYEPVAPVTVESDCPLLTMDLSEGSLRLSEPDGRLIMVTDLEPEAITRVAAEFRKRTQESDPHSPPFDYGPHPDYPVMSLENAPF